MTMMLAAVKPGLTVCITEVLLEQPLKRRLEDMGFLRGKSVTPIYERGGDLIVKLGEARVAVNRGVAMRIMVK